MASVTTATLYQMCSWLHLHFHSAAHFHCVNFLFQLPSNSIATYSRLKSFVQVLELKCLIFCMSLPKVMHVTHCFDTGESSFWQYLSFRFGNFLGKNYKNSTIHASLPAMFTSILNQDSPPAASVCQLLTWCRIIFVSYKRAGAS